METGLRVDSVTKEHRLAYVKDRIYYGHYPPYIPFTIDSDFDLLSDFPPQSQPVFQPLRDAVERFRDLKALLLQVRDGVKPRYPLLESEREVFDVILAPYKGRFSSRLVASSFELELWMETIDEIIKSIKEKMSARHLRSYEAWKRGELRLPVVDWLSPASSKDIPDTPWEFEGTVWENRTGATWELTVHTLRAMYRDDSATITLGHAYWFIEDCASQEIKDAISAASVIARVVQHNPTTHRAGRPRREMWDLRSFTVEHVWKAQVLLSQLTPELDRLQPEVDNIMERHLPRLLMERQFTGRWRVVDAPRPIHPDMIPFNKRPRMPRKETNTVESETEEAKREE